MSEWKDKIENDAAKAKMDAVDQELVKIAVAIYRPEIEGVLPDLLGDNSDPIDCNDAIFDYVRDFIHGDDQSLTYEENYFIARDIANYYYPTEG